ncbi:MAG: helix-turn-helix transcriptional regulator [Bryobacteraceae bacterium]|jgi:transcriptional regulator with XRE-family HTH domain
MKTAAQLEEFYRQIGEGIRKCRLARKLSQEALGKLVGLTRTSLTNIESGRQHPPLHTFCEIAEQLKAEVGDLLPRPLPLASTTNIEALAGPQVRDEEELAFIQTGIKGRSSYGDTTKKNSGDGRRASR